MNENDRVSTSDTDRLSASGDWLKKLEELTGRPIEARQQNKAVYLAVDCSSSMAGEKMSQARKGATGFAGEAFKKGFAVGLIRFSSDAQPIVDASTENASFSSAVERLFAEGSTNMAAGIEVSISKLADIPGERVICIVTDGQPDDREAALRQASEAKKMRIDIMTIGTEDADRAFLEQLATRKELSLKVEGTKLQEGITSMARMLPGRTQ